MNTISNSAGMPEFFIVNFSVDFLKIFRITEKNEVVNCNNRFDSRFLDTAGGGNVGINSSSSKVIFNDSNENLIKSINFSFESLKITFEEDEFIPTFPPPAVS